MSSVVCQPGLTFDTHPELLSQSGSGIFLQYLRGPQWHNKLNPILNLTLKLSDSPLSSLSKNILVLKAWNSSSNRNIKGHIHTHKHAHRHTNTHAHTQSFSLVLCLFLPFVLSLTNTIVNTLEVNMLFAAKPHWVFACVCVQLRRGVGNHISYDNSRRVFLKHFVRKVSSASHRQTTKEKGHERGVEAKVSLVGD